MHPFKYPFGMFLAFFLSFSKYKDVVHVDNEPSFCDHVSKGQVYEGLEGWWQVALDKRHDQGFIETIGCDECGLPLISLLDVDVVIPPSNIHLGEIFRSF